MRPQVADPSRGAARGRVVSQAHGQGTLMLTGPHADLVCANGNETDKDCGKDGSWGIAIGIALCFIASLAIPFIGFRHWYAGTKAAADTTGRAAMPAVGTAGLRSSGIELMDTKDAAPSLAEPPSCPSGCHRCE